VQAGIKQAVDDDDNEQQGVAETEQLKQDTARQAYLAGRRVLLVIGRVRLSQYPHLCRQGADRGQRAAAAMSA
jgi:hypothetical protein